MQTVLLAGGTGLTGTALSQLLIQKGYRVVILTRNGKRKGLPEYAVWNPDRGTIDRQAVEQADYIVHLAGAGVADKRWNTARKKEILDSRVQSSALLVKALAEIPNKVKAIIAASAIGWYGPDPSIPNPHPFVETDPSSPGFLGETCLKWEQSIDPVSGLNKRLVKFRTGLVLSREGGAFPEFRRPVNLGVAAILGNGNQVISWIHIDDLCNLYLRAIEDDHLEGVYNAVAPTPVSNKALTLRLAKAVKSSFYIPLYVPAFIIKAMLGEMSIEVLKSTTVSADKIRNTGFKFIYPTIEAAVGALTSGS